MDPLYSGPPPYSDPKGTPYFDPLGEHNWDRIITEDVIIFPKPSVLLPTVYGTVPGPRALLTPVEIPLIQKSLVELYQNQPPIFQLRRTGFIAEDQTISDTLDTPSRHTIFQNVTSLGNSKHSHDTIVNSMIEFLMDANNRAWLRCDTMDVMLQIIIRGLEDIVSTHCPYTIGVANGLPILIDIREDHEAQKKYKADQMVVENNTDQISKTEWRMKLSRKPIHAAILNFENQHHTAFIWDRRHGHVYYFDSLAHGREERTHAFILFWRQRLIDHGLATGFSYISVPCTEQPSTWECGYASLSFLLYTLRGLVGFTSNQLISCTDRQVNDEHRSFLRDIGVTNEPMDTSDLRVRDWCLYQYGKPITPSRGSKVAIELLCAMAGNEIGLKSSKQLIIKNMPSKRYLWSVKEAAADEQLNAPLYPIPQAYNLTALGGFCPTELTAYEEAKKCFLRYRVFGNNWPTTEALLNESVEVWQLRTQHGGQPFDLLNPFASTLNEPSSSSGFTTVNWRRPNTMDKRRMNISEFYSVKRAQQEKPEKPSKKYIKVDYDVLKPASSVSMHSGSTSLCHKPAFRGESKEKGLGQRSGSQLSELSQLSDITSGSFGSIDSNKIRLDNDLPLPTTPNKSVSGGHWRTEYVDIPTQPIRGEGIDMTIGVRNAVADKIKCIQTYELGRHSHAATLVPNGLMGYSAWGQIRDRVRDHEISRRQQSQGGQPSRPSRAERAANRDIRRETPNLSDNLRDLELGNGSKGQGGK